MRHTSPPHEQKLEFHRLRAQGQFPGGHEGWKLYQEWRNQPKPVVASNQPVEDPAPPVDTVTIDDYEPKQTAQEDLGF